LKIENGKLKIREEVENRRYESVKVWLLDCWKTGLLENLKARRLEGLSESTSFLLKCIPGLNYISIHDYRLTIFHLPISNWYV